MMSSLEFPLELNHFCMNCYFILPETCESLIGFVKHKIKVKSMPWDSKCIQPSREWEKTLRMKFVEFNTNCEIQIVNEGVLRLGTDPVL